MVVESIGRQTAREIMQSIFHHSIRVIFAQLLTDHLMLDVLQKYAINSVFLRPFNILSLCKRMLTESYNLPNLKSIVTSGSALSEVTKTNFSKSLPNVKIRKVYGMTEIVRITRSNAMSKPKSLGYLMPGISAKVRIIQISKPLLAIQFNCYKHRSLTTMETLCAQEKLGKYI